MKIRRMNDWPGGNRSLSRRGRGVRPISRDANSTRLPDRSVRRTDERGSAILVVLMLMLALAAIVVANTQTLRHLKQEIMFVDQEQRQKHDPGPGH